MKEKNARVISTQSTATRYITKRAKNFASSIRCHHIHTYSSSGLKFTKCAMYVVLGLLLFSFGILHWFPIFTSPTVYWLVIIWKCMFVYVFPYLKIIIKNFLFSFFRYVPSIWIHLGIFAKCISTYAYYLMHQRECVKNLNKFFTWPLSFTNTPVFT